MLADGGPFPAIVLGIDTVHCINCSFAYQDNSANMPSGDSTSNNAMLAKSPKGHPLRKALTLLTKRDSGTQKEFKTRNRCHVRASLSMFQDEVYKTVTRLDRNMLRKRRDVTNHLDERLGI